MSRVDQPLEFRRVSERNLQETVRSLNGYLKFASMVWIRALRQPILDGLIVRSWSIDAKRALNGFCDRYGCDEALIRIDAVDSGGQSVAEATSSQVPRHGPCSRN